MTTEELYRAKAELKQLIRVIERRGRIASGAERETLKTARAQLRRVRKELANRVTQGRLF